MHTGINVYRKRVWIIKEKRDIWDMIEQVGSFIGGLVLVIAWFSGATNLVGGIFGMVLVGVGLTTFFTWKPQERTESGSIKMLVCPQCGTQAPMDSAFCKKCGTKLSKDDVANMEFELKRPGYQKIVIGAAALVMIALVVVLLTRKMPVADLKAMVFDDNNPNGYTFGEVVDGVCTAEKWDSSHTGSGVYTVTVTGILKDGLPEPYTSYAGTRVNYTFTVEYYDDGRVYCSSESGSTLPDFDMFVGPFVTLYGIYYDTCNASAGYSSGNGNVVTDDPFDIAYYMGTFFPGLDYDDLPESVQYTISGYVERGVSDPSSLAYSCLETAGIDLDTVNAVLKNTSLSDGLSGEDIFGQLDMSLQGYFVLYMLSYSNMSVEDFCLNGGVFDCYGGY